MINKIHQPPQREPPPPPNLGRNSISFRSVTTAQRIASPRQLYREGSRGKDNVSTSLQNERPITTINSYLAHDDIESLGCKENSLFVAKAALEGSRISLDTIVDNTSNDRKEQKSSTQAYVKPKKSQILL
jgi:hypothetical protein